MAIVKMRKLSLVAMAYDKDLILDALHRTNAAEITLHEETENTVIPLVEQEDLISRLSAAETTLFSLTNVVATYEKEHNVKSDLLKDGVDVSYSEFISADSLQSRIDAAIVQINDLIDEKNTLKADLSSIKREKRTAEIYQSLDIPFSEFLDTAHTRTKLGLVSSLVAERLFSALDEFPLCAYQALARSSDMQLFCVSYHKEISQSVETSLAEFGFSQCPYTATKTGRELYEELTRKEKEIFLKIKENDDTIYSLKETIRDLKLYCDYLSYRIEKANVSEKMRSTKKTFLLQAYVPTPAEEEVSKCLRDAVNAVYFEFSDPSEEEEPPTLLSNRGIVSNFEGITNTYSVPNYREFDPNAVMAFFYSVFMGFIIGDMGYGLLMFFVGGYLWWKHQAKPTGMSRLAGAFSIGGIFAILWGALFNSVFGLPIFSKTIMPNPQSDMWTFVGISVPSVLIISMEIGVVQLLAGYLCKAVQEWRRGNVADGIFDGVVWAIFTLGVGIAIVGLTEEAGMSALTTLGGIMAGASLALAIVTAGRKEKLFGKFTKGFGTAYGVINFASDILSYARLYGLMLSGAVIAQIIGSYGMNFLLSGNILLCVLGVAILLVGHAFNLVMNLLGAYIHDARLQYVEFYGRFYEGNGQLFAPLGSNKKYISIQYVEEKIA